MVFYFLATARSPPPGCRPGGVHDEAMSENEPESLMASFLSPVFSAVLLPITEDHNRA
jgi:hypothetical protein